MKGRKPKPNAMKALAGNPGKRELNQDEPRFEAGIPDPPAFLNKEAKVEWDRVAVELYAKGVLAKVDRAALAAYCRWWAVFAKASEELDNFGLMQTAQSGYEAPSGWLALMKQASEQMHKFATEFGMTPSSRSRLKVTPPPKQDEFETFLGSPVVGKIG